MGAIKKFMLLCLIVLCTMEVSLGAPTMEYVVAVDQRNNQPYIPFLRSASDFFRNHIFDYSRFFQFPSASSTSNNPSNLFNNAYQQPASQGYHPFQPSVDSAGNAGAQALASTSHFLNNGLSSAGTLAADTAHGLINTPLELAKGFLNQLPSMPTTVQLPDGTHVSVPPPPPLGQSGLPLQPAQVPAALAQLASNLPLGANAQQSAATATAAAPNPALPQPPLVAPAAAAASATADAGAPVPAPLASPPSSATATSATG